MRAEAFSDDGCMDCHSDTELTGTTEEGLEFSIYVDQEALASSSHASVSCVSCHADVGEEHPDDGRRPQPVLCRTCHERPSFSYEISVHGEARQAGEAVAPTCQDCHGHHTVLPPTNPESPLHFSQQTATCGACHPTEAEDVAASVHGRDAAEGVREAPACTDCHMEHSIQALTTASPEAVVEDVCSKCHASERLNTKFGLPADRVSTFFESYHGLAVQGGSAQAANCASCHGYHRILPSSDPASSVHSSRLVETCGQCHPGISERFALGPVHLNGHLQSNLGERVNWWVRRLYLALIFVVIGSLAVHNLLSLLHRALAARRARGATLLRMDLHQRVQHFVLLASFILLALSGFALKYPHTWVAWLFGGDEAIRRWSHRGAGVLLLSLGVWHLVYLAFFRRGRHLLKDMRVRRQDLLDVGLNLKYFAGTSSARPKFGRFGYVEKFEYWAVIWGTIIMGITGLAIWLKVDVTQFAPRWVVDVATTIHYYEAILACLAIVVWHLYYVIFAPGTYPMNWAWWDGKVPQAWHEEDHPLEVIPSAPDAEGSQPRLKVGGRSSRLWPEPASATTALPLSSEQSQGGNADQTA